MQSNLLNNRSFPRYSFAEMKTATNGFANLLEEADFAKVYRGNISANSYSGDVAVKRMAKDLPDVTSEFQNEIQVLTAGLNHPNIVSPVGYCDEEDEKIVVYEFMKNGSLYDCIFNRKDYTPCLTVEQRLEICLGVAKALTYLHSRFKLDIKIHYDLIAENVLLDAENVPKISGFRFSRNHAVGPSSSQQINNYMQGTQRDLAPECYEPNYKRSQKAEVYAFGVLLLEVLCEKQPRNRLLVLGLQSVIRGELPEFTPPHVKDNITPACAQQCEKLISDCLEFQPDKRPDMNQVVHELQLAMQKQDAKDQNIMFQANNEEPEGLNNRGQSFSLGDIKEATDGFSTEIGNGAFGIVYRGKIFKNSKKVHVAVKRMTINLEQGISAFEQETKLLVACDHTNIICLLGYCDEGDERILVYEYMPKGSLYDYLHNHKDNTRLTVEQRLEICLGVAKGLNYLHSRKGCCIIHSDVKTENILLDGNLVPKISDFGLSRIRVVGSTSLQVTHKIQGTDGYIGPECYEPNYRPSRKADVYAFGVVLLEVLCEKPAWERLVIWALPYVFKEELPKLTPEYVEKNISPECSRACAKLIKDCLEIDPSNRPSMSHVITHLESALTLQKMNANSNRLKNESQARRPKIFSFENVKMVTTNFGVPFDHAKRVYHGKIFVDVAVKRWTGKVKKERYLFENVKDLLSECHHANIISLEGYCDEPDEMILMYEFMPKGSLYCNIYRKEDDFTPLKVEQRLEICLGVAKGLSYLHSRNIIHCSLKSKNILLDDNLVAKITRFDFSTKGVNTTEKHIKDRKKGMRGYLAPECYEPNYKESQKADVYAFGVIFLEVLCERKAKEDLVRSALPFIMRGQLPGFTAKHVETCISSDCSQACANLISDCLENDPDKRPSMDHVVNKLEIAVKQQMQMQKQKEKGRNLGWFHLFLFLLIVFFLISFSFFKK